MAYVRNRLKLILLKYRTREREVAELMHLSSDLTSVTSFSHGDPDHLTLARNKSSYFKKGEI